MGKIGRSNALLFCLLFVCMKSIGQDKPYQAGLVSSLEMPVAIVSVAQTQRMYDFGKTYFARLKLSTAAMKIGDTVNIRMGEKLGADRRIDTKPGGNIRFHAFSYTKKKADPDTMYFPDQPNAKNTSGNAILLPSWMGVITPFRYLELSTSSGLDQFKPQRQIVHFRFNDNASFFTSSDSVLNKIWDLCKHSIKATSFAGLYIDGDRERIPYEADALINQLSHYAVDATYDMAQHTIDYLMLHPTWPTEWHLQMHQVLWNDYLFSGNTTLIAKYYDLLKTKTLISLAGKGNLISTTLGKQHPSFLDSIHYKTFDRKEILKDITDWPQRGNNLTGPEYKGEADEFVFCDYNSIVNAYHYKSLLLMEKFACILTKAADEMFFSQRAAEVKKSFVQTFLDPQTGLVRDGDTTQHASFHANFFALCFGLLDENQKRKVLPFVVKKEMACSVYGSQFLLDALYENGMEQEAFALLTSRKERGWYHMIEAGAGMTTEAWDTRFKPNQDWNHAWGAAPANIIAFRLMGIRPVKPGFKEVVIDPQPGKLTSAIYQLPTPMGMIRESIVTKNGKRAVEVVLPPGMQYQIIKKPYPIRVTYASKQ